MSDLKEFDLPNFKNSTFRLDRPSKYLLTKARRDPINGYSNLKKSMKSSTVYIGKLSFNTTEEQLFEIFSKCGTIKKIIMGLDKLKLTPTGFCFIIFESPEGALNSVKFLNKTKINGNVMEIDLDTGFEEGRQFGRGADGGQRQQPQEFNPRNRYNNRRGGYNNRGRDSYHRGGRGNFRGGRGGYRERPRYQQHQQQPQYYDQSYGQPVQQEAVYDRNYDQYRSGNHYNSQYRYGYQQPEVSQYDQYQHPPFQHEELQYQGAPHSDSQDLPPHLQ